MRGWGRSSTHVTPSVTSGTYSPGPAIREPPAMTGFGGSVYGCSIRTVALLVLQSQTKREKGGRAMEIVCKEESYRIMGGCFEVYKEKGCGFLEAVYQECLEIEFEIQGILFVLKKPLALSYKGRPLKQRYEPDLICLDRIIVELKAVSALADEHRAQVLNYLNATGFKLGLLVNFGHYPKVE